MDHNLREKLLRMREEDQLPQKLIIMVERAEHELKMLGGGTLSMRDLVILSAVVPRIEDPVPYPNSPGEVVPLVVGTHVKVLFEGELIMGYIVGKHGKKFRVRAAGEHKSYYRIFEAKYIEAI